MNLRLVAKALSHYVGDSMQHIKYLAMRLEKTFRLMTKALRRVKDMREGIVSSQ